MAISEEELNIFIQHLVPAGRHNAQAVRFFRRFFTSLITNISETATAQSAANQAGTDAANAQDLAEDVQADLDALELVTQSLVNALQDHVDDVAGLGVLGHVMQGPGVTQIGALGIAVAPAAYDPAHSDSQTAAINALQAKIDTLISSLSAAGVIP